MTQVYINADQAYLATLERLLYAYDYRSAPRGIPVREVLDDTTRIMLPHTGPVTTKWEARNVTLAEYHRKEMLAYLYGGFEVSEWTKLSKFWANLSNPDGTINSNYGALIFRNYGVGDLEFGARLHTPWDWAKQSLIKDRDSRQAFVRVSLPRHQWHGNRDQVCTMHVNFLIRGHELRATTVMRSQDVIKGWPYDVPFFIYLQHRMRDELLKTYPDLKIGAYTHFVHSLHLYEKDYTTAQTMLRGLS